MTAWTNSEAKAGIRGAAALDRPLGMSERAVLDCIQGSVHWPMECALTPAALAEVETAIRARLSLVRGGPMSERVQTELSNLASNIRAHLQHVVAERAAITPQEITEWDRDEPIDELLK